ncbi:hypothetical protein ACJX0J_009919, partial [Zea mays]
KYCHTNTSIQSSGINWGPMIAPKLDGYDLSNYPKEHKLHKLCFPIIMLLEAFFCSLQTVSVLRLHKFFM